MGTSFSGGVYNGKKIQSDTLMKAHVGPMTNEECEKRFEHKKAITIGEGQICALGLPWEKDPPDTCQNDSGGPVVNEAEIKGKNRAILVGITSWGVGCSQGTPGVYTRVSEYIDWIKKYTYVMYTV